MQAKCKLALKEASSAMASSCPLNSQITRHLGRERKEHQRRYFSNQVPVLYLPLRSWGTLGKPLDLSLSMHVKWGVWDAGFLNLCSSKILISGHWRDEVASVQHHYKKPDCDRTSGFTLVRRKDFSGLWQSDFFLKIKLIFLYLLSSVNLINMYYSHFIVCRAVSWWATWFLCVRF